MVKSAVMYIPKSSEHQGKGAEITPQKYLMTEDVSQKEGDRKRLFANLAVPVALAVRDNLLHCCL